MGKGGELHMPPRTMRRGSSAKSGLTERAPTEKPPFTIGMLRKAIPTHCFERSVLRSSAYLVADLVAMAAMFAASTLIDHPNVPRLVAYGLLWPLYWFFQGAVATGVWVIAHECGHQAFSKWQAVNDGMGLVLHSCLLVPYYSWKHSHRRHHSNTASLSKDEVFLPSSKEQADDDFSVEQLAPVRLAKIVFTLTLGWPMYLFLNTSGRPYPRWANHFDPYSPIFTKRERTEIAVSDAALVAVVGGLISLGCSMGWMWLTKTYVFPYLMVNMWLVMITLLQHTHPKLPHYQDAEWDWLRGALATVDRDYGFVLNHLHHHIADTHVAHHLFSQMPHYHAQEATEAIRPVLGPYYNRDHRNIWAALWQDYSACRYVAPDEPGQGTLWYHQ